MRELENQFKVDYQYGLFLSRIGLREEEMNPEQKVQLRQSFYGAWSQFLFLLRDDVLKLSDRQKRAILDKMQSELADYWEQYTNDDPIEPEFPDDKIS